MTRTRPRLSHRHLLALGTFLVPLAVLAMLGWSELQRSGELADAALDREARQFLASARQAIDQQLDLQLPAAFAASERLLAELGPIGTALHLRDQEGFPAAEHIVLLDDQAQLVWPTLPPFGVSLPLARDPQQGAENAMQSTLAAAELLLTRGEWLAAMERLEVLIETLEAANPPGSARRPELEETEVHARFRLGAVLRATGEVARAREQFTLVQELATDFLRSYRFEADIPAFRLLATAALAELGEPAERLAVLHDIAENRYDSVADGLSGALANRLAATFAADSAERAQVDRLLREERQRSATREFAASYELVLKYGLRMRMLRSGGDETSEPLPPSEERIVATLGDETSLLAVRRATDEELRRWQCTHVGIDFDLEALIRPGLQPFLAGNGNFALAVHDPDNVTLVPPPTDLPAGFVAPSVETNGLVLHAYPSDPAGLVAASEASARVRTLLLVALFVTALGGALWSWRSVSREAELAALKIDLVSRVSHELKTPLALIRMYGETLGMGRARDQDQAAEFGSIIARESERLTTLIQRILDFSRQQAGTLEYSVSRNDLGELLRAVAYAYAPHLEAKGALLIDDLPSGIVVRCDRNGLEGAVVNLLENATKYGPPASEDQEHEIDLVLRRAGHKAVVEVLDRGRGIPAAERHRVFEGFYRASNAGEVRGAGLGLGIVRHFARAHGGDIEALPREGGGTIMRLELPLADEGAVATPNEEPGRTGERRAE